MNAKKTLAILSTLRGYPPRNWCKSALIRDFMSTKNMKGSEVSFKDLCIKVQLIYIEAPVQARSITYLRKIVYLKQSQEPNWEFLPVH